MAAATALPAAPAAAARAVGSRSSSSSRSRSRSRRAAGTHCPFLILLVCLVQLASRFPAALAFVVGLGGAASRAASTPTNTCPTVAMASSSSSSSPSSDGGSKDLLVVGMGTLGSFLGRAWREAHGSSGAALYGETSSTARHEELRGLGVVPTVREDRASLGRRFANVVFCVPPSKNEDYVAEVEGALALWSGEGGFVFTSSGGVFAEDGGGKVHEASPVTENPRMAKILAAERAVVEKGGIVIRLAGLYTKTRGPHTFWLARGEVGQPEEGIINLLHYEDAARATMAGLLAATPAATTPAEQRILLIADDVPLTRKEICAAAVASPFFQGQYGMPAFKPPSEGAPSLGKVYDTSASRRALGGWVPKYPSFADFMAAQQPAPSSASEAAARSSSSSSSSAAARG